MEEWKPYKNYQVSNMGQVKRYNRLLKLSDDGCGYLRCSNYENGKQTHIRVHKIVALAWIPNPDNLPEIDHINRDKTDNRVENLRWVSRSENSINRGNMKNNKLGHKHICECIQQPSGREYYVICIPRMKIQKRFNKNKYTLEQVILERDKMLNNT